MLIDKCGTSAYYMYARGKMVGFIHFAFATDKPLGRYIWKSIKYLNYYGQSKPVVAV